MLIFLCILAYLFCGYTFTTIYYLIDHDRNHPALTPIDYYELYVEDDEGRVTAFILFWPAMILAILIWNIPSILYKLILKPIFKHRKYKYEDLKKRVDDDFSQYMNPPQ